MGAFGVQAEDLAFGPLGEQGALEPFNTAGVGVAGDGAVGEPPGHLEIDRAVFAVPLTKPCHPGSLSRWPRPCLLTAC